MNIGGDSQDNFQCANVFSKVSPVSQLASSRVVIVCTPQVQWHGEMFVPVFARGYVSLSCAGVQH